MRSSSQEKPDISTRIAVVVAGMHRSGTSSLTKVLSACGYALPKTLLSASGSNEAGFWESSVINRLNDKLLQSAGVTWGSWQPLPVDLRQVSNFVALQKEALETLDAEFGAAASLLLKDPRLCRLMSFWFPVLEKFGTMPVVVCPIRNPLEVAASLEKRNSLPQALGLLIWLRYQLEIESDTRGRPRAFTHYNALLADWRQVIDKIVGETGLVQPQIDSGTAHELTSWLSPKLRHHQFTDAAALHDDNYPEWVRSAYAIFLKWSQTGEDETDFPLLDRISHELNAIPKSLQGILAAGQKHIDDTRRLRKTIETQTAKLAEMERQTTLRDAEAKLCGEHLARAQSSVEDALQRWAQREAAATVATELLQESRVQLAAAQQRQDELSLLLSDHERKLSAQERGLMDAEERQRELERQNEEMVRRLAQTEAELTLYAERDADQQRALDELGSRAEELQKSLAAREVALGEREQQLAQIEQQQQEALHQLAQKDGEARRYAERMRDAEHIQKQQVSTLREMEGRYAALRTEADVLKSKLLDTRKKRDTLIHERDITKRKMLRLESKLHEIRRSRAWKVAKKADAAFRALTDLFPTRASRNRRRLIETVQASPLFDGAWYMERYPDVAKSQTDPALHYVRHGAHEGRDPGPAFSTSFYLERHPDVARHGVNPLFHYEQYGRREKRRTAPAGLGVPSGGSAPSLPQAQATPQARRGVAGAEQPLGPGVRPFSMPVELGDADFPWLAQTDLVHLSDARLVELGGLALARLGTTECSAHDLPPGAAATMALFARLTGMPEMHALRLREGESLHALPKVTAFDVAACNVHGFHESPVAMDAIWYANDRDLRIRFNGEHLPERQKLVVRGYQYDPAEDGGMALLGEHRLSHAAVQLADFALVNPYLPVLLTLTTADALIVAASLLPFPSLCPGGAHEAEPLASHHVLAGALASQAAVLLAEYLRAADGMDGWALGRIMLDIREATGAEKVFSTDIKEWLWSVFAIQLDAWNMPELALDAAAYWREVFTVPSSLQSAASLERHAARAQAGLSMICPPGAIPSIHVLCACKAEGGLARTCSTDAYVIAQQGGGAHWLVDMPPSVRDPDRALALTGRIRHPFVLGEGNVPRSGAWRSGGPIAVLEHDLRPRQPSQLIMPIAPEINPPLVAADMSAPLGKVNVVFTANDVAIDRFEAMLESLQLQCGVGVGEILVASPDVSADSMHERALRRRFPQRHRLLECSAGASYAERAQRAADLAVDDADDTCLLFINHAVVLHDPRTLDTLVRLACLDQVATAACLLVGANDSTSIPPVQAVFSGILPVRQQVSAPTECLAFDAQALFPLDVYPVAGNGDALFVMKAGLWRTMGGFQAVQGKDRQALLELSASLAERGLTHLFTTSIAAEADAAQPGAGAIRWTPPERAARALHAMSACIEVLPS